MNNYFLYHCHSSKSLLDSTTDFTQLIDKACENGMTAIAFTEHGNIFSWVKKKRYCEKKGIKYVHGIEAYLTQKTEKNKDKFPKIADNYHIVLLAKNEAGVKEINRLFSISYQPDNFYYKPRIPFDEFLKISDNVIITSACLGGPLRQIPETKEKLFEKIDKLNEKIGNINFEINKTIVKKKQTEKDAKKIEKLNNNISDLEKEIKYINENIEFLKTMYVDVLRKCDYLEIQYHNIDDQREYNQKLYKYARKYGKKLIAGTDTHSIDEYSAKCRIQLIRDKRSSKKKGIANEGYFDDDFDLIFKTYDELVNAFKKQNALPESIYMQAIKNTLEVQNMIEDFSLDTSFKYPDINGVDDIESALKQRINERFQQKLDNNIIPKERKKEYIDRIREEFAVLKKIGMLGFILFMSNLVSYCRENKIYCGPNRGSVGGCLIAYITDIIDLDPMRWGTIFSRFANEDRVELGDIDIDISPDQRDLVYDFIMRSYNKNQVAYIITFNTLKGAAAIDSLARTESMDVNTAKEIKQVYNDNKNAIRNKFPDFFEEADKDIGMGSDAEIEYIKSYGTSKGFPSNQIKEVVSFVKQQTMTIRQKYPEIARCHSGLFNVPVSQGIHPAGIVVAPNNIDLYIDYGVFMSNDKPVLAIDMDEVHDVALVKYDILGLKQVQILKHCCESIGLDYLPRTHLVDFEDKNVWDHITDDPVGVFQFESKFSFGLLEKMKPRSVDELTLLNASLRPSGTSYRNDLIERKPKENPSPEISELLAKNNGYLVYQEDIIRFLQYICGLSGSQADTVRRDIAHKNKDKINAVLPQILDGYCKHSKSSREKAEKEAKEFIKIIEDASDYMFGYNHSTGYSIITYESVLFRTYFPAEFIAAYLNASKTMSDIIKCETLAKNLDISYLNDPEIRAKKAEILSIWTGKKVDPDSFPVYPKKVIIKNAEFGKSGGYYTFDEADYAVYKGVGSVKSLNAVFPNELLELSKTDKYANVESLNKKQRKVLFYDFIQDALQKTSTEKKHIQILIKLNFFKVLGPSKTLLKIFNTIDMFTNFKFDKVHCKQINKADLNYLPVNREMFDKCIIKEAPATYKVELDKYFRLYFASLSDEKPNIKEQLNFEKEYVGQYSSTFRLKQNAYFVDAVDVYNKKNNPYLTLYNLRDGSTIRCLVKNDKMFIAAPLKPEDIIYKCRITFGVPKLTKVGDTYVDKGATRNEISEWTILKD